MSDSTYRTIAVSLTGDNKKAQDSLDEIISKVQILRDTIQDIVKNQKIRVTATVAGNVKGPVGTPASAASSNVEGPVSEETQLGSDKATQATEDAADALREVRDEAGRAGKAWSQFASGAVGGFKTATSAAKTFLGALKDVAVNGVQNLVDKCTDGFKTINSFLSRIGRVAVYRAIRSAIREVTQAVNEGIQNLYRWSRLNDGEFSGSMDRLATEALHLKNSLGAMLAPVINALVPIVERLAHAFINVVNGINQFISAITGATTWTMALHTPITYAQAMGSGFDKATKKAKELKNTILGFDEINRLNDNTNNGSTTEGGVPELPYGSMFKKMPLTDFWKKWLNTDDWTELGRLTAKRLNAWLKKVDDWILNVARPWAMKWSTRIATFLNGLVEAFDWNLLGKTVADGLMTIVYAVNNFFRIFNATALGKGLAMTVDTWLRTMDWQAVGQYFANGINFIADTLSGFLSSFVQNAPLYGAQFATAFKSWVDSIHWDEIRSVISDGLKSIAGLIHGFVTNEDGSWDKLASELSKTVNTFLESDALNSILVSVAGLINDVVNFLGTVNWEEIGYKVGLFLGSIDWLNLLGTAASALWNGLVGAIKGVIDSGGAGNMLLSAAIVAAVGGLISLAGSAISTALASLGTKVIGAIGTWFSATLAPALTSLLGTLANPVTLAVGGIVADVAGIFHLANLGMQIAEANSELAAAKANENAAVVKLQAALAAQGVNASLEDINAHLNGTISMAELTGGKFGSMADVTNKAMSNVASTTADTLDKVGESTFDFTDDVNKSIVGFLTAASDGSAESMKTLSDDTIKLFSDVSESIGKINQELSNSFSRMARSISESMQNMYNSVSSNMTRIAKNVEDNARRIQNAFNSVAGANTTINVQGYATGGFPEDGLFMANHNELVGQFANGKTAVANNAEIVEGIEQGVYNAVSSAMSSMTAGDSGDIVIRIDSEELARASMRGQRRIDRRMNPTVKFTG